MDLPELHRRARTNPRSISKVEWNEIFKIAFSVPKKDFENNVVTIRKKAKEI